MIEHLNELKHGFNTIADTENFHQDMFLDIGVYKLNAGEQFEINESSKEAAILLLQGKIVFQWMEREETASRKNVFDEGPTCLHVSKNTPVTVKILEDAEVLTEKHVNDRLFDPNFYTPQQCSDVVAGADVLEGTSKRIIRTVFDYSNASYSNMVIGEVINTQGRWSSYPPHHHPQPEVYYYRFDKPQGFGVSMIGEEAALVHNHSVSYIPGGLLHPQVTAPGYPMFYVWMIPHFEGNPWTERIYADEHKWLVK